MATIGSMETATTTTAIEITIDTVVSAGMRNVTSVGGMTGIGIATPGLTMIKIGKVIAARAGSAVRAPAPMWMGT
jgi:hypothetical protein